jgi:hypothetical protein
MKIKTSELQGAALDWAVAKCEGVTILPKKRGGCYVTLDRGETILLRYSTDWAQGGPIIECEEIALEPMTHDEHGDGWLATRVEGPAVCMEFGQTMLIAAMRCFVVSKLGDEIEAPEELK